MFIRLGRELMRAGHAVRHVNFCGGDVFFGLSLPRICFRGRHGDLRPFYEKIMERHRVTDLVLFGDCRIIHQVAMAVARERGVRIHVFEEGYIRPDWITLERDGVNGYSSLPRDPEYYRARARQLPENTDRKMPGGFKRRVFFDILYYVGNALFYFVFPHFRTHRFHPMPFEYAGWLRKLLLNILRRDTRRAAELTRQLQSTGARYYLFPLQLDTDFQIRTHSPFGRLAPAIRHVLGSFAANAPKDALLVVKNHPLDNGMVDLRRHVEGLARELGLDERVRFIDGGHLPSLLATSQGVVVVNSTVGFSALVHGKPVKALGAAFYDMPGLTHQGDLDSFWTQGHPPDPGLVQDVRSVVLAENQLNGNLFTEGGLNSAVPLAVERLTRPYGAGRP